MVNLKMAPSRQPPSLFNFCIKKCIQLINSACYTIEKRYPVRKFNECEREAISLKCYLMSMLPSRLFDVLCSQRICCIFSGDPRIQLLVLTHPNLTVFCKTELDNNIPQQFWIGILPNLNHLIVLDLKFVCSDEILEVIGANCLLLEQLNIISRVDICKSLFNASVLVRSVSDGGLCHIANLKRLRILSMDPPRNERAHHIGRRVSQTGIIKLIVQLPCLEELIIETCDIGSTLISAVMDIGPLSLTRINRHFASAEGMKKLVKICPHLRELSVTRLAEANNKDEILEQISISDLRLDKLNLSFFSYTESLQQLLEVKGVYLTHFSLWEIEHSLNFDNLLSIGMCCPNLNSFCLTTQSKSLIIPRDFRHPKRIFSDLRMLTIGIDNFDIKDILTFFLKYTSNLEKLKLKYQTKTNIDDTLLEILEKGYLKNLNYLWLDCTLEVSKTVILKLIKLCEKLQMFTVEFMEGMSDIHVYICDNNLDVVLGGY